MAGKRRLLEIFVLPRCFGCDIAIGVAERVRVRHADAVDVRLIDLSDPISVRPDAVVAVPTYRLDGRIISLGNPDETWLSEALAVVPT